MRLRALCLLPAAVLLAMTACGEDEAVKKTEIIGLWQATKVEYVCSTRPAVEEMISQGCTATLLFNQDGTMEYTLTPPAGQPTHWTATWELTGDIGDLMRVTPTGVTWYWAWDVKLSSSTLELTGADVEHDFDDDGHMESATWNLVLKPAD